MSKALIPVIITRAQPGASETATRVAKIGAAPVLSPVLDMVPDAGADLVAPETLSGLIFTSANGVRAYAERSHHRALPAWCVGPATAMAAKASGFETVHESAGNAVDLADYIVAHHSRRQQPLLHVANAAAKGDLNKNLTDAGVPVAFAPLYAMRAATHLSTPAHSVVTSRKYGIILIHSAMGAENFATLSQQLPIDHLTVVAISDAAARPLVPRNPRKLVIASAPNEDRLMNVLQSIIATLSA